MSDECLDRALNLLKDPSLSNIRRQWEERPLTWHDFTCLPQPQGLSAAQTWDLVTALRRQTAIEHPRYLVDNEGHRGWYSFTQSMRLDLDEIDSRCREGSWLDSAVRARNATHFLAETHVNHALSALREDGVALSPKRAREILLRERDPGSPEEQLLLNTHRLMSSEEPLLHRPCTPGLIRELHERVAEGVPQQTTSQPAFRAGDFVWTTTQSDPEDVLQVISAMANHEGVGEVHHPILLSLGIDYLFANARPLPSWNGVLGALVTRLLFLRSHLPVLALVPIAKLYRAWEAGAIKPPIAAVAHKESFILAGDEIDFTICNATVIRLVRIELDATETAIRRVIKQDESLSELLSAGIDHALNHRQRAVLSIALDNPATSFNCAEHRTIYRVAYATARADLRTLVDLGFLRCARRSHAFVYTPVPHLLQVLRQRVSTEKRFPQKGSLGGGS